MKNIKNPIIVLILFMFYFASCGSRIAFAENIEATLNPIFRKAISTKGIYSLALSKDGRYLAIGRTNAVEILDTLRDGEAIVIESQGARDVTSLKFSHDGKLLAIGGYGSVELWSLSEKTLFKRIEGYGGYITSISFSPDSRLIAAGSRGSIHAIRIWETESGRVVKTLEWDWKYADEVKSIDFSHDGLRLVSLAMDRIIRVWNLSTGAVEKSLNIERTDIPVSLSLSPDSQLLLAGTSYGQIVLWRLVDGLITRRINAHSDSIFSVAFSKDGKSVTSAGSDARVCLWDAATGIQREEKHISTHYTKLYLTENGQNMAGLDIKGVASYKIAEPRGLPPVIAILYPAPRQTINNPEITVTAKIIDDSGINDIVLELNGKEIITEGTGIRDLRIRPAGESKELDLSWNMTLERGMNNITISAYDAENLKTAKSIEVNYSEERGDVWGVVIGISKYRHIEGLKFADKDALAIYEYLTKDNGIPDNHITFLSNEDATLLRIKDVLGVEIKGKAKEKDTVIIYFAGHGASEPDRESPDGDGLEKYFLTYDSDPQRLYSTALPMQEMARIFSRIDAERIVLIQDTCYSGASGGRTIQTASIRASISDAYMNRITKGKGRVIITASKANEVSMEKDSLGHGVFTYYLLEALQHGDADSDGFISTGEAFRYISEKVPEATNRNQHPVKKGEEIEGEIIIGKVRGE